MFFDQSKGRFMCPFITNSNQSEKYLEPCYTANSNRNIREHKRNFYYLPFNNLSTDSSNNSTPSSAFRTEFLNSTLFSYGIPYPVVKSIQPIATSVKPRNTEIPAIYNKPKIDSNELVKPILLTKPTTYPSTVVTTSTHNSLPNRSLSNTLKQSEVTHEDSLEKFKACIKAIPNDLANCKKLKDYLHMMRKKPLSITTIQQQKSILLKFCKMSKEPPTIKDLKRFLESKKVSSTPQSLYSQLRAVKRFLIEEFSWDEQQFSSIIIKPRET